MGEAVSPQTVKVKLSVPGGGSLERAVFVDVVDLLTGSATPVADYNFSTHMRAAFSLPAGDGDTCAVTIEIVDDMLLEGDETLRLDLADLGDGTGGQVSLAAPHDHLASIADDDRPPVASDDSYSTAEDTPRSVATPGILGNDADADGDVLTAVKLNVWCMGH